MIDKFLSKKIIASATIFLGGILIISGVLMFAGFIFPKSSIASQFPQWTQSAGRGISVPACVSSGPTSTCNADSTVSVSISWSDRNHIGYANGTSDINFYDSAGNMVNSSGVLIGSTDTENYTWAGAKSSTAYSYKIFYYNTSTLANDSLYSGSFTTPNCVISALAPPPPTGLTASCPSPGTTANFNWNATSGATYYAIRVNDIVNGWTANPDCTGLQPYDYCVNNNLSNSATFSSIAGDTYYWWVHACNANGCSRSTTGASLYCTLPSPSGTISASPNPCSILSGNTQCTSTITWSSSNASNPSVYVNGALFAQGTSGSQDAPWISSGTTYVFTLYDKPGGSTLASVSVTATSPPPPPPPPAPTASISASPTSITSGQSSTLSWTCTNSTSASIDQGIGSVNASSGSKSVSPTTNTTYALTCTGSGGSATASATVTVNPPVSGAPTLTATLAVCPSTSVHLSWTSVSGTDYYYVRRCPGSTSGFDNSTSSNMYSATCAAWSGNASGTSITDITTQNNTTYTYGMVAHFPSTGYSSTWSNLSTVTPSCAVAPSTGTIEIERVGSDLTVSTVPTVTYAQITVSGVSQPQSTANPAYFTTTGTGYSAEAIISPVAGYTISAGLCGNSPSSPECSVSTFFALGGDINSPNGGCNLYLCQVPVTTDDNWVQKVVFKYNNNNLPGNFTLSSGTVACNSVSLSWTASSGASGYRILKGSARVDITPYQPYTALNFTDTSASQNTSYQYQIEAYNNNGTNRSNEVKTTTPYCPPTLNFSASPTSISQGQSTTLIWSTTYANSCAASGGWSGSKAANGSEVVFPSPPPNVTYTLTCTGPGGTVSQSATVNISTFLPTWKEIIPR